MSIVNHAKKELEKFTGNDGDDNYSSDVKKAVIELIECFENQDHSGFSAGIVLTLFDRLAKFKTLTPLTGEDNEWMEVTDNLYQNKRHPEVFKENGKAHILDGNKQVPIEFPYLPD